MYVLVDVLLGFVFDFVGNYLLVYDVQYGKYERLSLSILLNNEKKQNFKFLMSFEMLENVVKYGFECL